ncbi:MAG: DUF1194 domain-containing protein [Burkholderiales bacterium]|nr:DUF1194 domain-containing protein [Burkholderiales bacterium]
MLKSKLGALAIGVAAAIGSVQAHAVPVGLELALMADVSGSLGATDFNLQRDGYVAAFENAAIQNAIAALPGGIAVTLVYRSDGQAQSVGWTHITDAASANAFATAIAGAPRPSSGGTGMTAALTFTAALFDDNGFEGARG